MKQMSWDVFQMKFPEKAANYPGGEQAFTQSNREDELAWSGQFGGPKGPRQNAILQQGGQNPYEWEQGGGGQNPLTALGLGGYQGGQGQQQILGGPRGQPFTGNPMEPPPSNPIPQWGSEVMKGFGKFGEQLGGYKEQMGGFGEQLGGFGEQLGGFKGQFENIDSRLQNMEQGISGLTDKMGVQQQPQNPFQMYGGYNPYGGGRYGGYSFFKGGGQVRDNPIVDVLESLRPRMAGGGTIMDYTQGGQAVGPGTATSDSIPAFLSDGEFVMTNKAVKGFGGGNREQGAQKLYSMMKKAEASA